MIGLNLRVSGISEIKRKLQAAKQRGGDNVQFAEYAASRMYKKSMQHFRDEQGPGGKWEPLSQRTIAQRRQGKGGGSPKALQDTGRLRSSILFRGFKDKAIVFTNMIYGAVHQYGFKHIPARPFLWIEDAFIGKIKDAYLRYIKGDLT